MYEFIWRLLPGNWFVKTIISALLIAVIVFVLMQYVFPVIAPYMPFNDATIEGRAAHATAHAAADTIIPGADL
ncbi:hypothetical protein CYJ40_06850 [Brevibacterium ravenspurgense]|uniref:Uncharacterized protein n=1 Tax=Brevibacterium ravenspurgense TaxID=479117 RepID=A0A2I1IG41_9MICO|nr:hypothetical protein [Brevibacterium ravenspurgense]PKY70098.1 hypothetical protein CYJ40_06850 [Brevibacterium ravenspurgense]